MARMLLKAGVIVRRVRGRTRFGLILGMNCEVGLWQPRMAVRAVRQWENDKELKSEKPHNSLRIKAQLSKYSHHANPHVLHTYQNNCTRVSNHSDTLMSPFFKRSPQNPFNPLLLSKKLLDFFVPFNLHKYLFWQYLCCSNKLIIIYFLQAYRFEPSLVALDTRFVINSAGAIFAVSSSWMWTNRTPSDHGD